MTETKPTICPNCGRDSFLDLNCADCTKAYGQGRKYEYNKTAQKIKDERKRIVEKIKRLNKQEGLTMSTLNNEEVHILYDHDLKGLEKGDT